jgi:hypothetical protein
MHTTITTITITIKITITITIKITTHKTGGPRGAQVERVTAQCRARSCHKWPRTRATMLSYAYKARQQKQANKRRPGSTTAPKRVMHVRAPAHTTSTYSHPQPRPTLPLHPDCFTFPARAHPLPQAGHIHTLNPHANTDASCMPAHRYTFSPNTHSPISTSHIHTLDPDTPSAPLACTNTLRSDTASDRAHCALSRT